MSLLSAANRPDKVIGLYISWWTMNYPARLGTLISEAKEYQINTFVCDFRSDKDSYRLNLKKIKDAGYYTVARIVVFEEGKGADYKAAEDSSNWQEKLALAKKAKQIGFDEIQWDYIRFSDSGWADPRKKEIVEKFLQDARQAVDIPIGVDVFGSVAYQPHLLIGQDLSRMANYIDAASPMLYPSHFMRDYKRMGHPYETMLEGSMMAKRKLVNKQVRLIPYIQGFPMNMSYAKLSLKDYIKAQIKAVEDANTDGFYVWHAANEYQTTFAAIQELGKLYAEKPKPTAEVLQTVTTFQEVTPDNSTLVHLPSVSATSSESAHSTPVQEKGFLSVITFGML
jgi:hypothetical protein